MPKDPKIHLKHLKHMLCNLLKLICKYSILFFDNTNDMEKKQGGEILYRLCIQYSP